MLPNPVGKGGVKKIGKREGEEEQGKREMRAHTSPAGAEAQVTEQVSGESVAEREQQFSNHGSSPPGGDLPDSLHVKYLHYDS